jgi:sialic acid synthase SpsE/sugar phosphate isomerase/epimerase
MQIEKKIKDYLVFSGDTVLDALKRINYNNSRIVFVVQDNGVLIGSVSDGDIRRWVTQSSSLDLNLPIDKVMNLNFIAHSVSETQINISQSFNHKLDIIPLLDEQGRFVALARKSGTGIQIGDFLITDQSPTFVIAEIGNNHNGDIGLARELVDLAIDAKADCVKFQMRDLSSLYTNHGKNAEAGYDLGSQYTLDLLNKFQLSNDELCSLFDYCSQRGILPLCTPWDLTSLKVLDDYGLVAFKVASADLTNFEMLEALGKIGKPIICSTGMSSEAEIKSSVDLLRRLGSSFSLLHCNSTYPTPFKDVNLSYLTRLKQLAGTVIGYSGHERGFHVPLAAVALGARIIEKHITIDRSMQGNDHKVSLLPEELAEMVKQIRNIEEAMGQSGAREVTQGELINRENLAKSLVINCNLPAGDIIQRDMIAVKSPGQGLQPNRIEDLVGRTAIHDFKKGDFFFEEDILSKSKKKNKYSYTRPYGIPARYHDYKDLIDGIKIDFIEFHLSYHDLDLTLSDYFSEPLAIEFAVHCPELFANDHILDLAADEAKYRQKSIAELKRTVMMTNKLNQFFPKTLKPVLVLNAGGWSRQSFLHMDFRPTMYERVADALNQIELDSVRLAIQTMPPFPWHFGGQSHHNLFVDPDEIATFSKKTGHKICLDVSHSMMACNFYKWDFSDFLRKVLPYTIHLHISDAKGVDGEGVHTGDGDVDFFMLRELLNEYAPNVQFIPEVWQGHKNSGEGFWCGLEFLEKMGF